MPQLLIRQRLVLIANVLVCLTLGVGCAHDLPGWKTVTTPHFRLHTDQAPRKFDVVLERLEEVHNGLASSFFSEVKIPPMEVFLFSNDEFSELLGDKLGGLFLSGGHGKPGALVMPEGWDFDQLRKTAGHELAHAFVSATFPSVPLWFNEGFASYCESIRVIEDKVWFGSSDVFAASNAVRGRLVPVRALFTASRESFHGEEADRHYTTAWALIHFIWHGEKLALRNRFDRFGATLAAEDANPSGSERAWNAIYGDFPLAEMDDRLRGHINAVFALPKSSLVGFRMNSAAAPSVAMTPADLKYVDQVRAALQAIRARRGS